MKLLIVQHGDPGNEEERKDERKMRKNMTRIELKNRITEEFPGIIEKDLEEFICSNENAVSYDVLYIVLKTRFDGEYQPTNQELAEAFGLPEGMVAPVAEKFLGAVDN